MTIDHGRPLLFFPIQDLFREIIQTRLRLIASTPRASQEALEPLMPGQLIANGHGHLVIAVLTVLFAVLMGPAATAIARRMATGFQTPFRLRHLCRIRPEQKCGTAFGFRRAARAWVQRAVFRHDDLGRGVVVEDSILFAPTIPG